MPNHYQNNHFRTLVRLIVLVAVFAQFGLAAAGVRAVHARSHFETMKEHVPLGWMTTGVAVGDVDLDGSLDIVATSWNSGTVSVLRNDGTGTFAPPLDYVVGRGAQSPQLVDLDDDGFLDLVAIEYFGSRVAVLRGLGLHGFAPAEFLPTPAGPVQVHVVDWTSDGRLDLVVPCRAGDSVAVFAGDGAGWFSPIPGLPARAPYDMQFGDFDGIPPVDYVLRDFGRGRVMSNFLEIPLPQNGLLAVGDIDGIGHDDLIFAVNRSISFWVSREDGTGFDRHHARPQMPREAVKIRATDVDGDGLEDLVLLHSQGGAALMRSRAAAVLSGAQYSPGVVDDIVDAAFGDLDGDGTIDMVEAGRNRNGVAIAWGRRVDGTLVFTAPEPPRLELASGFNLPWAQPGPRAGVAADLDGDGHDDFALLSAGDHELRLFRGTWQGPAPLAGIALPPGGAPRDIAVGNFDDDPRPELVVQTTAGLAFYEYTPVGGLVLMGVLGASGTHDQMRAADFDGDGRSDLALLGSATRTIRIFWRPEGDRSPAFVSLTTGPEPIQIDTGDMDGDGRVDLVLLEAGAHPRLVTFRNRHPEPFEELVTPLDGRVVRAMAIGDLDRDGRADLILSEDRMAPGAQAAVELPGLFLYRGAADGGFEDTGQRVGAGVYMEIAVADHDADGWPDLVARRTYGRHVDIFRSVAPFVFVPGGIDTDFDVTDVVVGDGSADGLPDLVLLGNFSSFHRNTAAPAAAGVSGFEVTWNGARAAVRWRVGPAGHDATYRVARQPAGGERDFVDGEPLGDAADRVLLLPVSDDVPADYWLEETRSTGHVRWYGPVRLETAPLPGGLFLDRGLPNPFHDVTRLTYGLAAPGRVRLDVFDLQGRLVRCLVNDTRPAGTHEASWDGRTDAGRIAAAGPYFLRLEAEGQVRTTRVIRLP
jgi:hypothetical protein